MENQKILIQLDLSKNEARIYLALVEFGEMTISDIAVKSEVNRRNVYDSINRLIEKGLVFEIRSERENLYKAVDPSKLSEIISEKEKSLQKIMPSLLEMYHSKPKNNEVYIYRGLEGWKNVFRDILRVGQDVYTIGGKGKWSDERLSGFLEYFAEEAEKKNIGFHIIFDSEVKCEDREILRKLESNHKFLPPEFSSPGAVDVFGNHVVMTSGAGEFLDDDISFTVIVNEELACAFRSWFNFMWLALRKKKQANKFVTQ
ncbi:MAG: hypothetical protein COV70_03215 [Parcubacteria group bacterium CG11_big_fil_rev_8_21_14_0_20_39_22]|nr:MAG: hypothetical protein COV70_03215 [Parcubacteria group bacterium CG11_big_fil_rev_8_21_14_0_20_39_22]